MTPQSPASGITALVLSAFLLASCGAGEPTPEETPPTEDQNGT